MLMANTNELKLLREIRDGIVNGGSSDGGSSGVLQDIKEALVNPNFSAVVIEPIVSGSCVYMTASGMIGKAASNSSVFSKVIGLAISDVNQNFAGTITHSGSHLDLTDWTAIVGTRYLTPGSYYYLDTVPGRLNVIAPTTPGLYSVRVGQALSPTNFHIDIQPSILL
jgi:hypothetical protein